PSTASRIAVFFANEGAQQNALAKTLPSKATIAIHAQGVRRWRNGPIPGTLWIGAIAVKRSARLSSKELKLSDRDATPDDDGGCLFAVKKGISWTRCLV